MPANSMTVINYNRALLPNRDKFKIRLGSYGKNEKTEYDFPQATPKQLRDIRQKLKKENQLLWIKVIGLSAIIIIGVIWIFLAL